MKDFYPAECDPVKLDEILSCDESGVIYEEKHDGRRMIVEVQAGEAIPTGKRIGEFGRWKFYDDDASRAVCGQQWHQILDGYVFDGELMPDGRYIVFDVLKAAGRDIRSEPLLFRKACLNAIAEFLPERVEIIKCSRKPDFQFVEGIVAKLEESAYGFGWYKGKRKETHDVVVLSVNDVGVATVADIQTGKQLGKVNGVVGAQVGDCIEVECFNRFPSGKFRSGRFVRIRKDKFAIQG